jgi:hypothetical protein
LPNQNNNNLKIEKANIINSEKIKINKNNYKVVLNRYISNRHTTETISNSQSSRSHSILTFDIISNVIQKSLGKITICDLAGSESGKNSTALDGK